MYFSIYATSIADSWNSIDFGWGDFLLLSLVLISVYNRFDDASNCSVDFPFFDSLLITSLLLAPLAVLTSLSSEGGRGAMHSAIFDTVES